MKPKNDLYELIQSLSKSEKRYFKVFARRHVIGTANNYEILFDAIAKQSVYDEEKLRGQFKGQKFIRHLSSEKSYLYQLILRSMRAYHASRDIDARLRLALQDIAFLEEKRLYPQTLHAIHKTKALAWQYERADAILFLLETERRIAKHVESRHLKQRLEALRKERRKALKHLVNRYEYYDLYDDLFVDMSREFRLRGQIETATVQKFSSNRLFSNPELARTFDARLLCYSAHTFYHQLLGQHEAMASALEALVRTWQEAPHQIRADVSGYKKTLFNYLASHHNLNRYSDFPRIFSEIRQLPEGSPESRAEMQLILHFYEVVFYLNTGQLAAAKALAPAVDELFSDHPGSIRKTMELGLCYNLSLVHFFLGEHRTSRGWLNRVIHQNRADVRIDLQRISRLLLLILYFEQEEIDLMAYLFRSAYRYFYTSDELYPFEKAVLNAMKRLYRTPPGAALTSVFAELKAELDALHDQPTMQGIQGLPELRYWLQAKLEHRPLRTVYEAAMSSRRAGLPEAGEFPR